MIKNMDHPQKEFCEIPWFTPSFPKMSDTQIHFYPMFRHIHIKWLACMHDVPEDITMLLVS